MGPKTGTDDSTTEGGESAHGKEERYEEEGHQEEGWQEERPQEVRPAPKGVFLEASGPGGSLEDMSRVNVAPRCRMAGVERGRCRVTRYWPLSVLVSRNKKNRASEREAPILFRE